MIKILFLCLGMVGAMFLLNAYAPEYWVKSFTVHGMNLSYALIGFVILAVLGATKLHAK